MQRPIWIIVAVIIIAVVGYFAIQPSDKDEAKSEESKTLTETNPQELAGRWLRPDGGYILEIRTVHKDGRLVAGYYNPQSINVSEALWRLKDNRLQVYVEMNDVNYPGSNYTLDYFPDRDQLIGAYFQAVQQQSFYVEFVRQPN